MGSLSMSMLLAHGPICMGVAEDIRGKGHPDAVATSRYGQDLLIGLNRRGISGVGRLRALPSGVRAR